MDNADFKYWELVHILLDATCALGFVAQGIQSLLYKWQGWYQYAVYQ